MASALDIASCIVARGQEIFAPPEGKEYLKKWGVQEGYAGCCFVLLGYCKGEYPHINPRKPNMYKIIE